MGTTESKSSHRARSKKHHQHRNERSGLPRCHHRNQESPMIVVGNPTLPRGKNATIAPLISSSPMNPTLKGSVLNYPFPMQRSHSEVQISPAEEDQHQRISGSLQGFNEDTYDHPKGDYDYHKHMQRVDEENRPVLERLCPDKMYVSTNDLRICDAQRLPPPLRCKVTEGFFRLVPPPQSSSKKTSMNGLL